MKPGATSEAARIRCLASLIARGSMEECESSFGCPRSTRQNIQPKTRSGVGGGQISSRFSPRTGGPGSYAKNSELNPKRPPWDDVRYRAVFGKKADIRQLKKQLCASLSQARFHTTKPQLRHYSWPDSGWE